jgi:perosamine synthetase
MVPRHRSPATLGGLGYASASLDPGSLDIPRDRILHWVASASDALYGLLRSTGTAGDVVLPAYTCIRVVQAIHKAGWRTRFVDISPSSGSMDLDQVASELTQAPGLRVLLVTHLHGTPQPVAQLESIARQHGALLAEDCAMAQGARVGSTPVGFVGDAVFFSFGLGKVVGLGMGGAMARRKEIPFAPVTGTRTNALTLLSRTGAVGRVRHEAQELVKRVLPRRIAAATQDPPYSPKALSPLSEEWMLRLLLEVASSAHLGRQRARSGRWRDWFNANSTPGVSLFGHPTNTEVCYPGLPLLVDDRDGLQSKLRRNGIDSARYFDYCAAQASGDLREYPGSRECAKRILVLPLHRESDEYEDRIRTILLDHQAR